MATPAPALFPVTVHAAKLDGTSEALSIGRLSVRNLYTWTHHLAGDRLPELVALTVGRPVEWVDTLTDEGFAALSAKCIELNFPRAMTLMQTDPVIAAKLSPLLSQFAAVLREAIKENPLAGQTLNGSSPAPSPSASAVETPTASST